jgi:argininosuccinate synthase
MSYCHYIDVYTDCTCYEQQVMRVRDSLSLEWARLCYNGFWFAPEMELVKNAMNFASKVSL